jgi:branched-chain amino acid transport system substrate-binding protein
MTARIGRNALNGKIGRRSALKAGAAALAAVAAPGILRAQANKEVVLAAVVALTGPNAAWGQRTWRAFQVGCDEVNRMGGIKSLGGAKIRYIVADTESKPEVAGSQTEKVISQGAIAITGTNQSAATIVTTQISEREQVPFVCATDVDPLITSRGFKYTFRTSPLIGAYARDLLTYVRDLSAQAGKPAKKLAILSENSIVGQSSLKVSSEIGKALGYEVVEAASYDASKSQNFTGYIAKYKNAGVDLLVGHNKPSDAILITRTMKELNFNIPAYGGILGGHVSSEYLEALGKDADNVFATTSWSPDLSIPGLQELGKLYRQRWSEDMDSTAAGGFTALAVIWEGLERAGSTDGKKLRDAIAGVDMKTGDRMYLQLRGAKFEPNGENERAGGLVFVIRNKTWLPVAPAEFAKAKAIYPKPNWA